MWNCGDVVNVEMKCGNDNMGMGKWAVPVNN
jgi:hypothetical protein